jgi:hypothetical protein
MKSLRSQAPTRLQSPNLTLPALNPSFRRHRNRRRGYNQATMTPFLSLPRFHHRSSALWSITVVHRYT